MSTATVVEKLITAKSALGAGLNEAVFLNMPAKAYDRTEEAKRGSLAPITAVLAELAFAVQSRRLLNNARKEYYNGFSRADFSYSRFRYSDQVVSNGWRLRVSSRALTEYRADFLWVPEMNPGRYAFLTLALEGIAHGRS